MWILQEISLASGDINVICGHDVASYESLYWMYFYFETQCSAGRKRALECCCRENRGGCAGCAMLDDAKEIFKNRIPHPRSAHSHDRPIENSFALWMLPYGYQAPHQRSETLLELMYRHADRSCEDSRDKFFALLSMQNDIENAEAIVDYTVDVHALFFRMLNTYTDTRNTGFRWFMSRGFERKTGLVQCGMMLMKSLRVSPAIFIRWLAQNPNEVQYAVVEVEDIGGTFGARPTITSTTRYCSPDEFEYSLFDVIYDDHELGIHIRGIAQHAAPGDYVYRLQGSIVGVVVRRSGFDFTPVSWAILTVSSTWTPCDGSLQRLRNLTTQPLPSSELFITLGAQRNWWHEELWGYPRRVGEHDLPSEEDWNSMYDAYMSFRLWLMVDLPIAVITIEGSNGPVLEGPTAEVDTEGATGKMPHLPPSQRVVGRIRRAVRPKLRQDRRFLRRCPLRWHQRRQRDKTGHRLSLVFVLLNYLDRQRYEWANEWCLWNMFGIYCLNWSYRNIRDGTTDLIEVLDPETSSEDELRKEYWEYVLAPPRPRYVYFLSRSARSMRFTGLPGTPCFSMCGLSRIIPQWKPLELHPSEPHTATQGRYCP